MDTGRLALLRKLEHSFCLLTFLKFLFYWITLFLCVFCPSCSKFMVIFIPVCSSYTLHWESHVRASLFLLDNWTFRLLVSSVCCALRLPAENLDVKPAHVTWKVGLERDTSITWDGRPPVKHSYFQLHIPWITPQREPLALGSPDCGLSLIWHSAKHLENEQ